MFTSVKPDLQTSVNRQMPEIFHRPIITSEDSTEANGFSYGTNTSANFPETGSFISDFIDPDPVLIGFYIPVFLLSVTANTLVIIVVIKYHYMRNVTNLFLVNLSIADLLVTLLCMPVQVGKAITLIWFYGEVMCKTFYYMQGVAVAASVFTITAMSVDRYLAITQTIRIPKLPNRKWAVVVIILLWVIALSIFAPTLWVVVLREEDFPIMNGTGLTEMKLAFCAEDWTAAPIRRGVFGTLSFVLVYAVPGCIMVLAYSLMGQRLCSVRPPFDHEEGSASTQQGVRLVRERKRVAWILLLLAVLFAMCWLPYNGIQLLLDIKCISQESVSWILPYALLLGHTNSAINPIVYCFMTRNFRRSVKKLLCRTPDDLSNRQHQRCKMHSLKRNGGTQLTVSGARVSRRLQCVGTAGPVGTRRPQLALCSPNGTACPVHRCHHEYDRSPRHSDPDYI